MNGDAKRPAAPLGTTGWQLGHRPALDAVRGLAVLLVTFGHSVAPAVIGGAATIGLALFFALSGYLITGLLVGDQDATGRIRLGRFYLRRARRLLPALAAFLGTMLALRLATVDQAVPAALYFANIAKQVMDLGALSHTWTLSVEEQFYAVWPVALLLAQRWVRRPEWYAVAGIGLVVIGAAWAGALLGGCAVALLGHDRGRDIRPPRWLVGLALVALLAVLPLHVSYGIPVASLAAPVIIAAAATARSWRPLELVGRVSYGAYLWHYPISLALRAVLPWWATFLVLVPLSLAVAAVSWVLLERPILRYQRPTKPLSDPAYSPTA
jgi:peptidoglycan/LPS O-acetylase OafA/YrhL